MTPTCRHGFNPETTMPEHLREQFPTCKACEWEAAHPVARFVLEHPTWGLRLSVFSAALSALALILAVGVVARWW
ncbi:MAG TPA: hypothetical protein VMS84_07900 [Mycobacterium sp.]|jgi:hypothetical protein|nr:hypothetical protein [Mycobacterium sp.]